MSDARLRLLERAAAAGDTAAAAELLRGRARGGALEPRRVELAAFVGDPAARLAAPGTREGPRALTALVTGLAAWGDEAVVRAAVLAARWAWGDVPLPVSTLEVAEAWLDCPCPAHGLVLEQAGEAVLRLAPLLPATRRIPGGWRRRERVRAARAQLVGEDGRLEALRGAVAAALACAVRRAEAPAIERPGRRGRAREAGAHDALAREPGEAAAAVVRAALRARPGEGAALRRALRRGLAAWALDRPGAEAA